jgi:hypothetical protein
MCIGLRSREAVGHVARQLDAGSLGLRRQLVEDLEDEGANRAGTRRDRDPTCIDRRDVEEVALTGRLTRRDRT